MFTGYKVKRFFFRNSCQSGVLLVFRGALKRTSFSIDSWRSCRKTTLVELVVDSFELSHVSIWFRAAEESVWEDEVGSCLCGTICLSQSSWQGTVVWCFAPSDLGRMVESGVGSLLPIISAWVLTKDQVLLLSR